MGNHSKCGKCGNLDEFCVCAQASTAASEQQASVSELPLLPRHEYCLNSQPVMEGYTAQQMQEYARAALSGRATTAADQQGDTASSRDAAYNRAKFSKSVSAEDFHAGWDAAMTQQGAAQAQAGESDGEIYARHAADGLAVDAHDAARYRWLRDKARDAADAAPIVVMMSWRGEIVRDVADDGIRSDTQLDEAMDAAMAAAMAAPATGKEKA